MTPKSEIEKMFRDQVLHLARNYPFARKLINSGRLSVPCSLEEFALQSTSKAKVSSGHALIDAPLAGDRWLIEEVGGEFLLLGFGNICVPEVAGLKRLAIGPANEEYAWLQPADASAYRRYGEGVIYLLRPDGHIAASFSSSDVAPIQKAFEQASAAESVRRIVCE